MKRKSKCIIAAAAAVLAAMATSTSVTAAEFHSESSHTMISGSPLALNEDSFTFKAGTVNCPSASYIGTLPYMTSLSLTLFPSYGKETCTAFGYPKVSIDVPEGCFLEFTSSGTHTLHLWCVAGKVITVKAPNCWVKMGSQTQPGITYSSEGSGTSRDIKVSANLSGVFYTQESKSFPFCIGGAGNFSDGKFTGGTTLSGINTVGEPVGLWYE